MGIYINPSNMTKEQWLDAFAEPLSIAHLREPQPWSWLPICHINNGPFTAAGVAFSKKEYAAFRYPDRRPKVWFRAPISALAEVTGVSLAELEDYAASWEVK